MRCILLFVGRHPSPETSTYLFRRQHAPPHPQQPNSFSPPPNTPTKSALPQKHQRARKPNHTQHGRRDQQRLKEMRRPPRRTLPSPDTTQPLAGNRQRQQRVTKDPEHDQSRPEAFIAILERLVRLFFDGDVRLQGALDGLFKGGVNVRLWFFDFFDYEGCVAAAGGGVLFGDGRGQGGGCVGAFGAPGDVVPVGEGVDVEDVDVGGHEEEVEGEGCEHYGSGGLIMDLWVEGASILTVPRIEVEEGCKEPETEC
jgi:hypothetical protein